jgi:hypothetical protein
MDIDSTLEVVDMDALLDSARGRLSVALEARRGVTADENRYIVETRISALRGSSDVKTAGLRKRIEDHVAKRREEGRELDPAYMRLTTARIEKEETRLAAKIHDLQAHQELSMDYNLEAIVNLLVGV